MAAIVINENRRCQTVFHHMTAILGSERPMMNPEMTAAIRIPEPVAESQFNPNTAASSVGLGTTGGTRCTILFRPGTGICGFVIALGATCHLLMNGNTFSGVFMIFFPVYVPQQNTVILRTIHGSHARMTSPRP